jgi:probable LLM family oxidoreductase
MELGVYTFGELVPDPHTGRQLTAQQRLEEIVAAARLADEAGLDVFAVGEHHRLDMAISATPVVLGALASVTKRVRLASAVTILSTADPVRVFEDFATVDLLSGGRAEIIAGRGAFIESFALFGYNTADYNELFPEKLDLLLRLNQSERVTWRGHFRTSLQNAQIAPRPAQPALPIWVGVGGTPESAVRAGRLGLPMMLAIIGGTTPRFRPVVDLYRQAGLEAGHTLEKLRVGVSSHFHVAPTEREALDEFYPYYANYFGHLARDRGPGWQVTPAGYQQLASREGGLMVGSPQQVIDKLLYQHELFGHQRFLGQIDIGGLPFAKVARAIELLATQVAPVVRRATAHPTAAPG